MIELYAMEQSLKLERELQTRRHARDVVWIESQLHTTTQGRSVSRAISGARRRLALMLLALADRLDPRAVVSVPHTPARPALNWTLHHA